MNRDLNFIYNRVSVRNYKEDIVPKEDIVEILKAGTYAPSGKNLQNWHFVVLTNKDDIEAIAKEVESKSNKLIEEIDDEELKSSFAKFVPYYTGFKKAPVLILVFASEYPNTELNILKAANASKEKLDKAVFSNPGIQNIGAAIENILLSAAALGYGTCWMTGPNYAREEIENYINFSKEGFELVAMTPLGVPADKKSPQPKRKPIEEVVTFID